MQTYRLDNFIAAPSDLKKREVTTLNVRYDPRNYAQRRRIAQLRDRAEELGVDYKISREGNTLKISLSGYKGAVKRVLNPAYRSSTRRRSSQKRSSSRRRSQRGGQYGGQYGGFWPFGPSDAPTPVVDGAPTAAPTTGFSIYKLFGKSNQEKAAEAAQKADIEAAAADKVATEKLAAAKAAADAKAAAEAQAAQAAADANQAAANRESELNAAYVEGRKDAEEKMAGENLPKGGARRKSRKSRNRKIRKTHRR